MSIRWTEEEARAYGLVQNAKGEWQQKGSRSGGNASLPRRDSREVPAPQQTEEREAPRAAENPDGREGCGEGRYRIDVEVHRLRKIDPDNLCPKWFIDELVRHGVLPDDSSDYIAAIEKRVVRVKRKEDEKTVIEIWEAA